MCVAVHMAVCGSERGGRCVALLVAVCGCPAAVRQCAAVCGISLRQCGSVWQ
jgi:hypothetical protein